MLAKERDIFCERVVDLLEADPENLFKTTQIGDRPEANFQVLALKRLQGDSWDQLAVEFRVAGRTLRLFYRNTLQEFKPHFKKYLKMGDDFKKQLIHFT